MANDPTEPKKSEWYLTPEEASRVAKGHREMVNQPPTDPIAPATETKSAVAKMAVFDESKHSRGQPENAGQFAKKGNATTIASQIESLADDVQSGRISRSKIRKMHGEEAYKSVQDFIAKRHAEFGALPTDESDSQPQDSAEPEQETEEQPEPNDDGEAGHTIKDPSKIDEMVSQQEEKARKILASADSWFQDKLVDRHFKSRTMAKLRMLESHRIAKQHGWKVDAMSPSGSLYYSKGSRKLRISDHDVPETAERRHNKEAGGFSWASDGEQINTSGDDDLNDLFLELEIESQPTKPPTDD